MSEHSRAPWAYKTSTDGRRYLVYSANRTKIATVSSLMGFSNKANVDLVTAAPELKHACDVALAVLTPALLTDSKWVGGTCALEALRIAINKAEGKG